VTASLVVVETCAESVCVRVNQPTHKIRLDIAVHHRRRRQPPKYIHVDAGHPQAQLPHTLITSYMTLKIVSWNINGLSTIVNYHPWNASPTPFKVRPFCVPVRRLIVSLQDLLEHLNADIICFQEHKLQRKDITFSIANIPGFDGYFSFSKVRKGYSGVLQPLSK
jgi:hypothetical protein